MTKPKPQHFRPEDLDTLYSGTEEKTISPYLSSAEIYKRFGKPGEKGKAKSEPTRYDAQGGPDADLWNKGSENFRERRRAAMKRKGDDRWMDAGDGWVEVEADSSEWEEEEPRRERRQREDKKGKKGKKGAKEQQAEEPQARRDRGKGNKNVGSEPGDRGDAVGLRIVGGKFRGTKLEYGGDRRVRPMKERVREAIFNLLGELPKGKHAIDLFAGTGALALEAISRGAVSATAIEVHFPTARITRNNIAVLESKVPGTASKIDLVTTDVYFWGRKLAATDLSAPVKRSPVEPLSQATLPLDLPWLVFCSPPYDFWIDREGETLELLQILRDRAPAGSVFVIEADNRFDFDLLEADIPPRKRRSYPPAEVALFTV